MGGIRVGEEVHRCVYKEAMRWGSYVSVRRYTGVGAYVSVRRYTGWYITGPRGVHRALLTKSFCKSLI